MVVLRGYGSQSYRSDVRNTVERDGRKSVLIYAGDLDASGEDIDRDFLAKTDCWDQVERVAVFSQYVGEFDLPVQPGKVGDPAFGASESAIPSSLTTLQTILTLGSTV